MFVAQLDHAKNKYICNEMVLYNYGLLMRWTSTIVYLRKVVLPRVLRFIIPNKHTKAIS